MDVGRLEACADALNSHDAVCTVDENEKPCYAYMKVKSLTGSVCYVESLNSLFVQQVMATLCLLVELLHT